MQDLTHALRSLARARRASAVIVVTLGLGIGGTTAMFSIVNGVMLSPLPYPDSDRILSIWERTEDGRSVQTSYPNFQDWNAASTVPEMAGYVASRPMTLLLPSGGVRARVSSVTANFFSVVGTPALIGRAYGPDENRPDGPPVAVVSEAFWRGALGSPDRLEGVTLDIDGTYYSVVGVLPSEVDLPESTEIWLPLERAVPWSTRGNHVLRVIGRLADGVDVAAAQRELDAIHAALREQHPEVENTGTYVRVLKDEVLGGSRRALVLLLMASGLLTLVACTNVASSLLAQGLGRRRELSIRASLGASRARLVRQLLGESAVLGVLGGVAGVAVATALVRLAQASDSGTVPRLDEVGIDVRVLLFGVGFGLASSLVFGLLPSLWLTVDHRAEALRARRAGPDRELKRSWRVMAGAEVTFATLLLIGAALTARSVSQIVASDTGVRPEGVVTGTLHFPRSEYDTERGVAFVDDLVDRLTQQAAVDHAGAILLLPIAGAGSIGGPVVPEGRERTDGSFSYQVAHPGTFNALGIPLLRGRLFTLDDGPSSDHIAVVDQAMADRLWPGEDPLGKRFNLGGMDPYRDNDLTVVGVVAEVRNWRQEPGDNPTYYLSHRQRPAFFGFFGAQLVASGPSTTGVSELLRATVSELDPDVPVRIETLESLVIGSASTQRFAGTVLGAFAALALLLAALGLYSVLGYMVAQQRRDTGIRLALGAERSAIFRSLLSDAVLIAAVGVGIGVASAAALGRFIEPLLVRVSAVDPWSYGTTIVVLLGASTVAGWWPARRALRVDPAVTLRGD